MGISTKSGVTGSLNCVISHGRSLDHASQYMCQYDILYRLLTQHIKHLSNREMLQLFLFWFLYLFILKFTLLWRSACYMHMPKVIHVIEA